MSAFERVKKAVKKWKSSTFGLSLSANIHANGITFAENHPRAWSNILTAIIIVGSILMYIYFPSSSGETTYTSTQLIIFIAATAAVLAAGFMLIASGNLGMILGSILEFIVELVVMVLSAAFDAIVSVAKKSGVLGLLTLGLVGFVGYKVYSNRRNKNQGEPSYGS